MTVRRLPGDAAPILVYYDCESFALMYRITKQRLMQQHVKTQQALLRPVAQPLCLSALPDGVTARLAEIRGGRHLHRKLAALGLRPGSDLRVEQRRGRGLVVAAGVSRIALGGGIADKLLVVPLSVAELPAQGAAS
jgi:ferrous iron transport protein A